MIKQPRNCLGYCPALPTMRTWQTQVSTRILIARIVSSPIAAVTLATQFWSCLAGTWRALQNHLRHFVTQINKADLIELPSGTLQKPMILTKPSLSDIQAVTPTARSGSKPGFCSTSTGGCDTSVCFRVT